MSDSPSPDPLLRIRAALADRYRVDRELGAGGMATVYLARDLRHDREVAIKVLHTDVSGALGHDRFIREIKLAASLTHPHILPLYDSGESSGILFFVMPVMRGQTLRERMTEQGPLPMDMATRLADEVADALAYAHRQGIVHRDIKPENILLHEGHAIVADFGIGKALAAARETSTLTQVGMMIGTPAYMSPEQAAGEELDGRSDLFALGCVMYELLTGEASLVEQLLERDAVDRPASASEVVTQLRTPSSPQPIVARVVDAARNTIAVLPFVNMSADADNEYFSDGLTEEIITDRSRVKALRVTSRTSSTQHKGSTDSPQDIGRALAVRYLLTGSVRRAGDALRIAAQLVDAQDGRQLWGDKYNGTMDDVFDLQERVSREIVSALGITLNAEEARALGARGIVSARAYELYLEARAEIRRSLMATNRWVELIDRAVAIEGNTPALRGLRLWGDLTRQKLGLGSLENLAAIDEQSRALVNDAPDRAWGYAALAYANIEHGDMGQAIIWFRKALERDPSDADSWFWYICALGYAGLLEEAAEAAAELEARDPLSPQTWLVGAIVDIFGGTPKSALSAMERALAANPNDLLAQWDLGYVYMMHRDTERAQPHVDWMLQTAPNVPYVVQANALQLVLKGDHTGGLAALGELDLSAFDGHLTFHFTEIFALAGNIERAMENLAAAVQKGFSPVDFIETHCPLIEPVRTHPGFAAIVETARARRQAIRESLV